MYVQIDNYGVEREKRCFASAKHPNVTLQSGSRWFGTIYFPPRVITIPIPIRPLDLIIGKCCIPPESAVHAVTDPEEVDISSQGPAT